MQSSVYNLCYYYFSALIPFFFQVVIVEGFTGCGKTTQVPQYILDDCYEKRSFCNIFVTQPRRVAALSIAERVCDERKWDLGKVVGYQV